jgi:phospholipase/lecithinase/hemolysin
VLWGGSNNFNNATVALPSPSDLVDDIEGHITSLVGAAPGERLRFLVPNLPPLGQTVRAQLIGAPLAPVLDLLSLQFNGLLDARLDSLRSGLDVTIFELDIFGLTEEILLNPGGFGFTNTTQTARLPDGVDVTTPGTAVVSNPNEYVFFDDVHPTTAWHEIVGARAFAVIPEPATFALFAFGLFGLIFIRRSRSHSPNRHRNSRSEALRQNGRVA